MNIQTIYSTYQVGSNGFIRAIQDHCGYDVTDDEIARIADKAVTADQFQDVWENESWWQDEGCDCTDMLLDLDDALALPDDTALRIHWEGEQSEPARTTPYDIKGEVLDNPEREQEYREYGYLCTEEAYQAEQRFKQAETDSTRKQ